MIIKIDLKIFLFAIIYLITKQIKIYAILMVFAFIHEMGHLIIGLLLGFKPMSINITPYGLQIEFKIYCEEYNKKVKKGNILCVKRAIIALAGPITNLVLVLLFIILPLENIEFNNTIIYSNILIGLFNLIPIYPLDGGRILKELLHIYLGLKRAQKYTNRMANATVIILTAISSVAILYLKNIAIVIIIAYMWYLVVTENNKYNLIQNLYKKYKEKTLCM